MHPLHAEHYVHVMQAERLRHATEQRRVRTTVRRPHPVRDRVGAGLVRLGTRLQARPSATTTRAATPC